MGLTKKFGIALSPHGLHPWVYMTTQVKDIETALKWRYATKQFDSSKKISAEDWNILEKALVLSPSSYGLQPWKFLVVQNKDIRKKLTPASWNQTQVEDCSHYVVFAAKNSVDENYIQKFINRAVEVRGIAEQSMDAYKAMMIGDLVKGPRSKVIAEWAARQTYIALGTLMTVAALRDIDACPMEGIDPAQYDEILNLKGTGYHALCACALGYRSANDSYAGAAKVRFESAEIIQKV